jgi:hypothetical protein
MGAATTIEGTREATTAVVERIVARWTILKEGDWD